MGLISCSRIWLRWWVRYESETNETRQGRVSKSFRSFTREPIVAYVQKLSYIDITSILFLNILWYNSNIWTNGT